MKQILSYAIALFFIGVFFISCNDELAPNASGDEQVSSINKVSVENDLSKKSTGDKKTPRVKYTSTVILSSTSFNVVPDYYKDKEPVSCYDYNYRTEPEDLDNTQFISISVEAHSLNSKDWFNTVLVSVVKDFDVDGNPDDDGESLLFKDNLDYYQKFTVTPAPVVFYWWGQWRDLNNYPCVLKMCNPGQYLLRVMLRKELKNKKDKFGVNQEVYSSVDDPNFQGYEGIAHGYVPVIVN